MLKVLEAPKVLQRHSVRLELRVHKVLEGLKVQLLSLEHRVPRGLKEVGDLKVQRVQLDLLGQ